MKTVLICAALAGGAFVWAGMEMGLFSQSQETVLDDGGDAKKVVKVRPVFPRDLAPAARAEPVPQAAEFNPNADVFPLVFVKATGTLHEWNEYLNEGWRAERVEDTQLVVVVGAQRKGLIDVTPFQQGPPVSRYKFELEASVIEAKTGTVLGTRTFVNMPRPIKKIEAFELTAIGRPVSFSPVYGWVTAMARAGFPKDVNTAPLINQVD
ncbi:MAG: hypothetical protein L0Y72_16810 [Gemmataceae bacterium]|nr:hypothetical protein [Gemmataceae bacterium]MCI0740712.1 hypothetical protein [Gemmataceae bacterium]